MVHAHFHHGGDESRRRKMPGGGDVEIACEDAAEIHAIVTGAAQGLIDAPELKRQGFAHMAEDDL